MGLLSETGAWIVCESEHAILWILIRAVFMHEVNIWMENFLGGTLACRESIQQCAMYFPLNST